MFNCCSHGTLLHFGLQSSRLNICYYHQDLHPRRLHPGPRPRLPCSPRRPSYSSRLSPRGSRGRRRPGMGPTLQRHPFSGLVDSAGIVHHLSGPIARAHAPPPRRCGRDGPVVRPAPRPPSQAGGRGSHLGRRAPALTFIAPRGFDTSPLTRARVRLLGPCFKTGRVGCRHRRRPLAPFSRGPIPARRRDAVGCALRTVRPGRQSRRGGGPAPGGDRRHGPRPPAKGSEAGDGRPGRRGSGHLPRPAGSGEVVAGGAVTLDAEATSHLPLEPFQADPGAGRGAPPRRKCARRGPGPAGGRSREGIRRPAARPAWTAELNPPGGLRGPHPFTSQRFHALLNSLFKVLFNFPLRYLSTIGLVPVFSLRWSLPPALGCIPKQPDSEKTAPRRDGGRYRPHTIHGLSLDQKDSGPDRRRERAVFRTPHFPRPPDGRGFGAGLFPLHSPLLRESCRARFERDGPLPHRGGGVGLDGEGEPSFPTLRLAEREGLNLGGRRAEKRSGTGPEPRPNRKTPLRLPQPREATPPGRGATRSIVKRPSDRRSPGKNPGPQASQLLSTTEVLKKPWLFGGFTARARQALRALVSPTEKEGPTSL
ncbi:hypothetical protein COCON_G00233530 [Conger conger]|uniref:Uncharacterized protein n=1 Tax=Conger conger TaxID=82655 RepID=A0A9Q1HLL2_CONCO|nr:hypothetical protein COCON_G00233530 [Conger conger]